MACNDQPEDYAAEFRKKRTEARDLKRYLRSLTAAVAQGLAAIDAEMKKPSTVERGRRIATISNALQLQNDLARRFGLGERL